MILNLEKPKEPFKRPRQYREIPKIVQEESHEKLIPQIDFRDEES